MIKIIDFSKTIRTLTTEEQAAGENVMRNCMEVKPGEKVLIVTDTLKEKVEAPIFFESAKKFTDKVRMIVMSPTGQHGAEPPQEITKLMKESDVVLTPTTYSLTHTQARAQACLKGARIATMPGITLDTILRTLNLDYGEIAGFSKKIAGLLTIAQTAELTSNSGTNMIFSLAGRDGLPDTGLITNSGDYGNLPAGEAFISPKEGTSKGILVFDACFGDIKLNKPLAFEVKNGMVTKALGSHKELQAIEATMNKIGSKARNIAELGVGTNKMAKPGKGILEVEKIYGTAHVALGNNAFFGGEVDVPYHMDGLIIYPILKLDGKTIIKNGKFLV